MQRLLCLGRIRTVVYDADHHPLDVGRSRRLVTTRQLTALLLRDGELRIVPLGKQRFRFELPDRRELPQDTALNAAPAPIEKEHSGIEPDAATTRWDGSRLDHD